MRRCEVIRGGLDKGEEARARLRRVTRSLTSLEDEQEVNRVFFFNADQSSDGKSTGNSKSNWHYLNPLKK